MRAQFLGAVAIVLAVVAVVTLLASWKLAGWGSASEVMMTLLAAEGAAAIGIVVGAAVFRLTMNASRPTRGAAVLTAIISAVLSVVLLAVAVTILMPDSQPNPGHDGTAYARFMTFLFLAPVTAIVALIFGAGVGQPERDWSIL